MTIDKSQIRGAHIPVGCDTLMPTLDFFVQELGFRIDAIFPADAPSDSIVSGYGLTLHLSAHLAPPSESSPMTIRLLCDDPEKAAGGTRDLVAPNGLKIRFTHFDPPMASPETRQALVLNRIDDGATWSVGRAGLRYRDLLPDRHGGAFIASHIKILEGGPVPDYVHFHKVRFQMIFCRKGWVRVVYEGQGEPFILNEGDCVLQPPTIRHRVLESSAAAEVVEIGGPAEHITMADHELTLPSAPLPKDHLFGGQRFAHHIRSKASWNPWRLDGFESQDTGIGDATSGLAGVRIVRAKSTDGSRLQSHDSEFCFYFVLAGSVAVNCGAHGAETYHLAKDDSIAIPGGLAYALMPSPDLEMLEVTLPGSLETLFQ